MKKTLITLLALSCTAMAGQVTDEVYDLANGPVTLANSYDLSQDWTMVIRYAAPTQEWLGTGSVTLLEGNAGDDYFTLTARKNNTGFLIVNNISPTLESKIDYKPNFKSTSGASNITLTVTYVGGYLNVKFSNGSTTVTSDAFDLNLGGMVLSGFSTGIGDSHVGSKWVRPTVTFTGATVTVPEPTTATLSLLALAGLAARRRRG